LHGVLEFRRHARHEVDRMHQAGRQIVGHEFVDIQSALLELTL
jgi:hypothetical protein